MSENVQKKNSSKTVVILLIVLVVLVIGGIVAGVLLLQNQRVDESSGNAEEIAFTLGYEATGVVVFGEDELSKKMEEAYAKMEDNMINVQYKHVIQSIDGVNFACYIGNPLTNDYDIYLGIYLDGDYDKQMLLTKLIPPGSLLEYFESEIQLDPGHYEAVLAITQVEDDHATIHGIVQVALLVDVGEGNITTNPNAE